MLQDSSQFVIVKEHVAVRRSIRVTDLNFLVPDRAALVRILKINHGAQQFCRQFSQWTAILAELRCLLWQKLPQCTIRLQVQGNVGRVMVFCK